MNGRFGVRARRAVLAAMMIAALPLTGCALVSGAHDAGTEFLVDPKSDGTFWGWSEITIQQDANSVKGATLQFARFDLPDDSPAEDLTFMQNVLAEVVVGDQRTPVAKKDEFPKGEPYVPLDLLY